MNNEKHSGHFFDGFILGIIVGGALVFLMGTKTGKNLLKILSEQGLDGVKDLMDEYNQDNLEEEFEEENPEAVEVLKEKADQEVKERVEEAKEKAQDKVDEVVQTATETVKAAVPKRRLFKRLRR